MKIISEGDFDKVRKSISNLDSSEVIFSSSDDDLNRKVMDKLKIEILLLSQLGRKDFSKQRNSGFNHVLAKIAKRNDIVLGIDLDEIIEASGFKLVEIISRVRQNIVLCNKFNIKMKFIFKNEKNKRNVYDLKSLGLVLGMPTWMIKEL